MFAHVLIPGFHAAVHHLIEPALRGCPVAVAVQAGGEAVLGSSSSEAQARGIYRGQTTNAARTRCPGLVVRLPDLDAYRQVQAAVSDQCLRLTPVVGTGNGAWDLDLTAAVEESGEAVTTLTVTERAIGLARRLRQDLCDQVGLTAVIGVGHSLLSARLAARLASNPRISRTGVVGIRAEDEVLVTNPLPVDWLPGVTTTLLSHLRRQSITTIGALRVLSEDDLVRWGGEAGRGLHQQVHGVTALPPMPYQDAEPQVSVDVSAGTAGVGPGQILALLGAGAEDLAERLVDHGLGGRRLTLTVRWSDGAIGQESILQEGQVAVTDLTTLAERLLVQLGERACPWSWLRLSLSALCPLELQLELFAPEPSRSWEVARERYEGARERYEGALMDTEAAFAGAH